MDRVLATARRLRAGWIPLLESIVAASVAWVVATMVVGHAAPFFAPAAAIIVLGQTRGMRIRRTVEILIGVAGGILLADVVAQLMGGPTTLSIVVIITLTLTITTAIGANGVAVTQAAVSALYVAVIAPPTETWVPLRFIDALVGGVVALLVNQITVVRDPLAPLVREMRAICEEICDVIDHTAAAIDHHDQAEARDSLERARHVDTSVDRLRIAVAAAVESLRLDVWRRRRRGSVQSVHAATRQLDYVVRGVRVLARASLTLARWPEASAGELGQALRHLAAAVGYVGESLVAEVQGDDDAARDFAARAETSALVAITTARPLLWGDQPLPVIMIVGQLRSITIDLLRGVGTDDADALIRVDSALGFSGA